MAVTVSVQAEDNFTNTVYFIRHSNGDWTAINKSGIPHSLSYFSDNAAEFYIALSNCDNKEDALKIVRKHGTYLKKGSIK